VPQTRSAAQKIWRAHKQALILGSLALAAVAGAAALAGLKPSISRFWTEVMAEVAARQVAGEFSPTGAVAVIVDSNGRV
jgi:hypothetical protein